MLQQWILPLLWRSYQHAWSLVSPGDGQGDLERWLSFFCWCIFECAVLKVIVASCWRMQGYTPNKKCSRIRGDENTDKMPWLLDYMVCPPVQTPNGEHSSLQFMQVSQPEHNSNMCKRHMPYLFAVLIVILCFEANGLEPYFGYSSTQNGDELCLYVRFVLLLLALSYGNGIHSTRLSKISLIVVSNVMPQDSLSLKQIQACASPLIVKGLSIVWVMTVQLVFMLL